MQQLLTGKTRLPGFDREWKTRRFGDTCTCLPTASNPRADLVEQGDIEYVHYGDVHAWTRPVLDCTSGDLPRIQRSRIGNAAKLLDGDLVVVDASEDLEGVGKSIEIQGTAGRTVIAVLTRKFGTDRYPLGRMRYTKLSYLLHRHEEGGAEGYLKKAAGPYNPRTRYGGPEKIALEKRYVRQHKSGRYEGLVADVHVDEAERYFDKWYGREGLQWVEQFRYRKNEELELPATVDMAVEELRTAGSEVSVKSVKGVILGDREWKAKINRRAFSDANISRAIESYRTLFVDRRERDTA